MEGLKLIAQSTFDRHQKFRSSSPSGGGTQGPYRYNVIEAGAFGSSQAHPSGTTATTTTVSKRQSTGNLQAPVPSIHNNNNNGSSGGQGAARSAGGFGKSASGAKNGRVTLNEWMVHEDDLVAFMRKRPVDVVTTDDKTKGQQDQQHNGIGSSTVRSSRAASGASNSRQTAAPAPAPTTTATTKRSSRAEVDAVASLKLICIQRIDPPDRGTTTAITDADTDIMLNDEVDNNTLAISRDVFLRLYVDVMDADHCALYYLAREYDGFHEFSGGPRGVTTKFLGTSDYALIWTFDRRTMETKGLFIDRCHRWQAKDAGRPSGGGGGGGGVDLDGRGSRPTTPVSKAQAHADDDGQHSLRSTPSRVWTRQQTGTVGASEAWGGFRDVLKVYKGFLFAPQLLGFVGCVHMLRSFDDHVNDADLPSIKAVERDIGDWCAEAFGDGTRAGGAVNLPRGLSSSLANSGSFAVVTDPINNNPFTAMATPPDERGEKMHPAAHTTTTPMPRGNASATDTTKLVTSARTTTRVDGSLADKQRHLRTARGVLQTVAREHETSTVDVVAPEFLDRYHWVMEAMSEAVPALERHTASLDDYLAHLRARADKLSALILAGRIATEGARQPETGEQASEQRSVSPSSSLMVMVGGRTGLPAHDDHRPQQQQQQDEPVTAVVSASTPAIFCVAIISIVLLRWSVVCDVEFVLIALWLWLAVAQKRRLAEAMRARAAS